MSSVNYNLGNKGVRLIDSSEAWVIGKNGRKRLNPKYKFIGKVDLHTSNMIISTNNGKPKYKGDVKDLNRTAKAQIVDHFYDERGKRNKKTVAYFGIKQDGK